MDKTGKRIILVEGVVYTDCAGHRYLCIEAPGDSEPDGAATLQRVSDGWTVTAHNTHQYPDGHIKWDFSTAGYWAV